MNPIAAQLLMPLSRDGGLDNLVVALDSVAPELRAAVAAHTDAHGKVCDGLHVHLGAVGGVHRGPQILSLTLLKLDDARLMAVI
ncbi:sensor domain-containing diguanylate cyclase, partial [Acinetobacter baumannii]|nr:sensor domain-containing diguanylate cyclase [Acinetobacter baumannii]